MMFHRLLGKHEPDPSGNRWDNGLFMSSCLVCGKPMVKPSGGAWQLARTRW